MFEDVEQIAVQRGLSEFRGGRPIEVVAGAERLIAVPIDGMTPAHFAAFKALCGPGWPRLAITSRRARVLGVDSAMPLLLDLSPDADLPWLWARAADPAGEPPENFVKAGPATAASIELAKLTQKLPALLVVPAESATLPASAPLISVRAEAILRFRQKLVDSVALVSTAQVPLREGVAARFHVFRDAGGGNATAIVIGEPDFSGPVAVRIHSACLTGDVFGSRRCDCGAQLQLAITRLAEDEGGVILYLEQEGRGLGLANKMHAYALQDAGLDTVDANTSLGFEDDERDYGIAARMLQLLGCRRVLLLTNNPGKLEGLAEAGIEVTGRVPLFAPVNADNRRYMAAKATRAGHWLDAALARPHEEAETVEPGSRG